MPGFDERDAEIYDRHAPAVYKQALLMLNDEDLACQVVSDVIVAECTTPAAAPGRASGRLAVSALRHCQELSTGQNGERALLGLVLFGGMGYREAARELEMSQPCAAALLRGALVTSAS